MLSKLIEIFELATIVLLFLCVLKMFLKQDNKELPMIKLDSPKTIIENHRLAKEQSEEQRKLKILLDNIENYSGDSNGQKEVK